MSLLDEVLVGSYAIGKNGQLDRGGALALKGAEHSTLYNRNEHSPVWQDWRLAGYSKRYGISHPRNEGCGMANNERGYEIALYDSNTRRLAIFTREPEILENAQNVLADCPGFKRDG